MQITEHTSTVLKLQADAQFFGLSKKQLYALVFALIGVIIFVSGNLVTLNCDRIGPNEITCQRITSGLMGKRITTINHLQGAEVEAERNSDDNGVTYRIILVTDREIIPLTNVSTFRGVWRKRLTVSRINEFINNPQKSLLKIREDDRWTAYVMGGLIIFIGGSALSTKQPKLCLFNKDSGQCLYVRQNGLFQSEVREEGLDNIKVVRVNETFDSKGKKTGQTNIILKSDAVISLGSLSNNYVITTTINQFLNLDESAT